MNQILEEIKTSIKIVGDGRRKIKIRKRYTRTRKKGRKLPLEKNGKEKSC